MSEKKTPTLAQLRRLAKRKGTWIVKAAPPPPTFLVGLKQSAGFVELSEVARILALLPDTKAGRP